MEQALDIHGDGVQVHQEIAFLDRHAPQRAPQNLSRTIVELPDDAEQHRATTVLDIHLDQSTAPAM
ncbi:hypothetical protein ACTVZO_39700 [Streptomyces sp. IBSNAI002]|uniref:hypothetical protein n=1 Tax=Streptomyces sp. IBSNAI002 TaxID=3457500 RepID=UPI003FD014D2